ncbi:hypothetical protein V1509DRAFT_618612 [Lipomyces kononenkoae]
MYSKSVLLVSALVFRRVINSGIVWVKSVHKDVLVWHIWGFFADGFYLLVGLFMTLFCSQYTMITEDLLLL